MKEVAADLIVVSLNMLLNITEFGKPSLHETICGRAEFIPVSIVFSSACIMSSLKKVHVRYLIS